MSLLLAPAVELDVVTLLADLRPEDREEWEVGCGLKNIQPMLIDLVRRGAEQTFAVVDEVGMCIAMWGHNAQAPTVWMLAANAAVRRVHDMHRLFKVGITKMHEDHSTLVANAYYKNAVHIKWMQRMGFEYAGDAFVHNGGIFLKFTREKQQKDNT